MRFLHTSDWQIGMRAVQAGSAAEQVRCIRLNTARRVIAVARREQVDFIVVAGDTFEHNAPEPGQVRAVESILADAHCPVLLLPGNHDRLEPGSIWHESSWDAISTLTILRESIPVELEGVQFLPCPVCRRKSEENPTWWITAQPGPLLRIVVAHGSVPTGVVGAGDHPIPTDTASRTGADYVALGHWHSTTVFSNRMAYSGSHEETSFGEGDSGNVLIVDIEAPGAEPGIQKIATGQLQWRRMGYTFHNHGARATAETSGRVANDGSA